MENRLLHPEIQQFINSNIGADISKLALTKNPFPEVDWRIILNQIAAKSKAKDKLPTWFKTENIIYPEKISIEQTSSEITAIYKSRLVSGNRLIDLTGGFGIDDFYFSKALNTVAHCEINEELSEIVRWNFEKLNAEIATYSGESSETLRKLDRKWDWIYIDPSRRNDAKGKVFMLKDCLPNVPENLDFYFTFSENILIKTAPLLDISAGLRELQNVKAIHIVAVRNEVKELLWILEKGFSGKIDMHTIDLGEVEKRFNFVLDADYFPTYALPSDYLYEPNAAIMKSGGFDAISSAFKIGKLQKHSHLYTSEEKIEGFPGRAFKIDKVIPYSKNEMAELKSKKANVTVRNFPDTVESIRKKWKITDGGDTFCFFTTDRNTEKIVLLCSKI